MDKSAKRDDFAESCRPLKELLDSVRKIEGFPIGNDEDILALSHPPYYTACPNPYISEFVGRFGRPYDEKNDNYECTPFVGDVSEGKTDPIYNIHTYHTKVPHKAIIKYIDHYTMENDIVFDGFCGTGMTGIASQILNRQCVLCDLSSAATFISHNYNAPMDSREFEKEAKNIISGVEKECKWMYETLHTDGKTKGTINYTIWSDIFVCPYCQNEYVFWEAAIDERKGEVRDSYKCPECTADIEKRQCKRAEFTFFDNAINKEVTQAKQKPVLINYSIGNKSYKKSPDLIDLALIKKIEELSIPFWFPTKVLPKGHNTEQPKRSHGFTNIHHFFTKRNLFILSNIYSSIIKRRNVSDAMLFVLTSLVNRASKMSNLHVSNFFGGGGGAAAGNIKGIIYIPSFSLEQNIIEYFKVRFKKVSELGKLTRNARVVISTNSCDDFSGLLLDNTIDYIFTDPPFGENIMYSELNFLWEAWLAVFTNNKSEAIINESQNKELHDYKQLMISCFKEMYRILKPNRWITVVFHNSKASVWNAIQDALSKAGFVIAQVTVLDKKQGSFKQVTSAGAVKNDLVINAYKPEKYFEESFLRKAGRDLEREFIKEHLNHLPTEPNIERTEQMLFSKMLAHYVQHGFEIRLNAKQFYTLLRDNFKLIDGYWFSDNQVLKYEEWKKKYGLAGIKEIKSGQQVLFVFDERSALIWLYYFLGSPKTYNDIYTAYTKAISSVEDQIPELKELLSNNFIFEGKSYRRPRTEKEQEVIEEQREKDLSKAFNKVLTEARTSSKKIKEVRKEAVAYGFTKAYQEKHFEDIIAVAKKLDRKILEENSEINDFVEIAQLKLGVEL